MKNGEEQPRKGKSRSIRYVIIFTICWITGFVLVLAWCTRAQAQDGRGIFAPKTNIKAKLLNCYYLHDLNMTDGSGSNMLQIYNNQLTSFNYYHYEKL